MTELAFNRIIKTSAEWTAQNPVLPLGAEGMESDTRYTKLGDGITAWSSLSYTTQSGDYVPWVNGTKGELPATIAQPLTTESGITLDDGNGNLNVSSVETKANGSGLVSLAGNNLQAGDLPAETMSIGYDTVEFNIWDNVGGRGFRFFDSTIGVSRWNVDGSGNLTVTGSVQLKGASTLQSGSGAPTLAGTSGDYYFRTDTPSTANQRIYVCTVTGAAGAATWVGIV